VNPHLRHCVPPYINYPLKSKVSIMLCCQLCSTCYTAVWINDCLKRTSAIKVATMKATDDFFFSFTNRNYHVPTSKLILFTVSKDEWDTRGAFGKSMKNALYVLQYAKRLLSGWNDIKLWKNNTLTIVKSVKAPVSQ